MKRALLFPLILLLAIILPSANGFCQARRDTINIDLGRGNRTTAGGWNNLIDQKAGAIGNLINSRGNNTGVSVAVTDPFNSINEANYAADDSLNIPLSASRDSFWGSTNFLEGAQEPTGGVTFSNLQVGTAYNFEFFASRGNVTNNRVSKYVVEGTTRQEVNLNASRNTSNVVRVRNVMPKADGAITVTAMEGVGNNDPNGTFFLGVIKVNYLNSVDPGPKSVKVKFPNGAEELKAGKPARITWERNNIGAIDIQYSIDNGTNWLPIASSVSSLDLSYTWTIPATVSDRALVRIKDSNDPAIHDVSDSPFTIFQNNGKVYTIVILGSSTAGGAGPTIQDSAWVWRFKHSLIHKRSEFNVVNLAVGGYTTQSILPNYNPNNNITKALSLDPDAIIVNMPSNDAAVGRSVAEQLANYDIIASRAAQAGVPMWVTTPQPRNFTQDKVQIQLDMIEATYSKFGETFTVDFWTGFNAADNTMKAIYNSGDGVHMNSDAHKIMWERIIGENITGYLENTTLGSSQEIGGQIRVYPNPANGNVFISAGAGYIIEEVQLVNTAGVQVLERKGVKGSVERLDVSGLPKGLYYLHLYTNSGRFHSKLVVQ